MQAEGGSNRAAGSVEERERWVSGEGGLRLGSGG